MKTEHKLQDYKVEKLRILREKYPELRRYLDSEIVHCYSMYCEMFYAAGWTDVNDDEFYKWATRSPLDEIKYR